MAEKATHKTETDDKAQPAETEDVAETAAENAAEADVEETAEATDEVARLREALLRAHAEMDNVQKRSAREIEKSRRFALERCIKDLVPVIDSLDQALANGQDESGPPEGMRLVYRQLVDALARYGLEVVDPQGQPFDPNWHEAMTMQPSEDAEPNTVLQVLQKGFKLHDRLLRPARVIVSRSPD